MERICCEFARRIWLIFPLMFLLQTSVRAQAICTAPSSVNVPENNAIGAVIATITTLEGVTLSFHLNPDNLFELSGNQLKAKGVLDYETARTHGVQITCTQASSGATFLIVVFVIVTDVNEHSPTFSKSQYPLDVPELLPVDTPVGTYPATDLDPGTNLLYALAEQDMFKLQATNLPTILVKRPLDYDTIKNVNLTLMAWDPPNPISFTATTTLLITIEDVDNRPPWFQPCTVYNNGVAKICQGAGYTGTVTLTEQTDGILPLEPGPLYAIDGDFGLNERITYSLLSGNDAGLFQINANSGNITMLKPADISGPINLVVLASQAANTFQFATTTVTIKVLPKSLHRPQFEEARYEGFVSGVGAMVLDLNNKTQPLWIKAKDDDFAEGENPAIRYEILGSRAFSLIGGYLFMTQDISPGTESLQVEAVDTSNDEFARVDLTVEVSSGLPTTTVAPSTTGMTSTAPIEMTTGRTTDISETVMTTTNPSLSTTNPSLSTTNPGLSTTNPGLSTTNPGLSTTNPGLSTTNQILSSTNPIQSTTNSTLIPTYSSLSTTSNPSMSTQGSLTTASTAQPHTAAGGPLGRYGPEDMAALGASLAILLFISLVVIGLLVYRVQKGKEDWRKINEASAFRSSLGQGGAGLKEGVQYKNEGFHNDEDSGSIDSGELKTRLGIELAPRAVGALNEEAILRSTAPLHALLPDDTSQSGSDQAESEKEVRPILTKERRMDEGYKSVWFKVDIDPEAKEEVVIIQDNGEQDREDEEEGLSSGREEGDVDNWPDSTQNVFIADSDMDSGLGVQVRDAGADSEDEEILTSDL